MVPRDTTLLSSTNEPSIHHANLRSLSAPEIKQYKYRELDGGSNEIRLLSICPWKFEDELAIIINHAKLNPIEPPVYYEALSYAWGSPENPASIRVGNSGNEFLPVTKSLATALPYLRYSDKPE